MQGARDESYVASPTVEGCWLLTAKPWQGELMSYKSVTMLHSPCPVPGLLPEHGYCVFMCLLETTETKTDDLFMEMERLTCIW